MIQTVFGQWKGPRSTLHRRQVTERSTRRPTRAPRFSLEQLESRCLLSHVPGQHIHPVLQIVIEGQAVVIPSDIGITATRHYNPHTHDTAGTLHVGEGTLSGIDPVGSALRFTTLDDFFDVWRTTGTVGTPQNNPDAILSSTQILNHVADATHAVRMTVNGVPNAQFETYSPHDGDQVVISYESVRNHAPLANNQNVNVSLNTPRAIMLTGDDNDPDVVQTLSFRVQTLPTNGTLRDSAGNAVTVGTTLPSANLTYTPATDFAGGDSFTIVAMDNGGTTGGGADTSAPATVTIAVATNLRPAADPQNVTAPQNTAMPITLTGNDGDPDATQAISFQVQTLPANGTLRDSAGALVVADTTLPTPNVTYTSNLNYAGNDPFTFIVMDNGGTMNGGIDTSLPATVSILVPANHAPDADAQTLTVEPSMARMITLTADDGDPDVAQTLAFRVQTMPAKGTLTDSAGNPVTIGTDLPTPTVTYAPNANFTGTDEFRFVAVDSGGTTGGGQNTSTAAAIMLRDAAADETPGTPRLTGRVLDVPGTPDDDMIDVVLNAAGDTIEVTVNGGDPAEFPRTDVDRIRIRPGAGDDTVTVSEDVEIPVHVRGGKGNDSVTGGSGDDVLRGQRGDDEIGGGDGDDHLFGGRGDEDMTGGDGDDHMEGRLGDDMMDGETGDDDMQGGPGEDTIDGSEDNDHMRGGRGHDHVDGGEGDDTSAGGNGEDETENTEHVRDDNGDDHRRAEQVIDDGADIHHVAARTESRQSRAQSDDRHDSAIAGLVAERTAAAPTDASAALSAAPNDTTSSDAIVSPHPASPANAGQEVSPFAPRKDAPFRGAKGDFLGSKRIAVDSILSADAVDVLLAGF